MVQETNVTQFCPDTMTLQMSMMVGWQFASDWDQNKIATWKIDQQSKYPDLLDKCSMPLTQIDIVGDWEISVQPWSLTSVPYARMK